MGLSDLFKENFELLKGKYPVIHKFFETCPIDPNIKIIDTVNGSKNAIYMDGGTEFLIHSKYDPEKEAERLVSQLQLSGISSIVVLGFGMGYHLKELYKRVKEKNVKIFVIESNISLFKEAIRWNDFTDLFSYDQFYLYLFNDYNSVELINFINDRIDIVFEKMIIFELPTVNKYFKEELSSVERDLIFTISQLESNRNTIRERGKMWEENLLNNLNLMLNNPGVNDLYHLYKDKPAILVAAGPSLSKNMHLLKEVKGKAIIIAVDAVLKVLLKNDIIPDIVTALDGYKYILKYFKDLDYSKLHNTVLLAVPEFFSHILEEWPGPVVFSPSFGINEEKISWLERYRGFMGRLATGGSVAHLSFAVANFMAADPIIFVGQDLAFTDNITHVKGNDYSLSIEEEMKKKSKGYLKVKDIYDNEVWTRSDFYFYLQWFNKAIEVLRNTGCQRAFIDATEGGVKIEGTEIMSLKKAINKYCRDQNNGVQEMLEKLRSYQPVWKPEIKEELKAIVKNIEKLKEESEKGLLLIDNLLGDVDGEESKILINKIGEVNKNIIKLIDSIIFFEAEIYNFYDLASTDIKTNYEKISNLVEFYNLIINGSKRVIKILNQHYNKMLSEEVI